MDEYISARRTLGPSIYYFKTYEYYYTIKLLIAHFGCIDKQSFINFGKNYFPPEYFRYLMVMALLDYLVTNKKLTIIKNINNVMAEIFPLVLPVQEILFAYLVPENFAWAKFIGEHYTLNFDQRNKIRFKSISDVHFGISAVSMYKLLKIIIKPEDLIWVIENLSPSKTVLQSISRKYAKYISSGDSEYEELKAIVDKHGDTAGSELAEISYA